MRPLVLAIALLALCHWRPECPKGTLASAAAIEATPLPAHLSETKFFADLTSLTPAPTLVPYELNAPFWSDGASKGRWFVLPAGTSLAINAAGELVIPVGTTAVKHFESPAPAGGPAQRLETRILIYDGDGNIHGAAYRWRDDRSDADLVQRGGEVPLSCPLPGGLKSWSIPTAHDCLECHTPAAGGFLGLTAAQVNKGDQLERWRRAGILTGKPTAAPALPDPSDARALLAARARAYLDANCANCHRPGGVATDFDLRFSTPVEKQRILDACPRIDLGLDGARLIAPADPWRSAILARMQRLDSNGMPPLAHHTIDERGVAIIRAWIESLPGRPSVDPPRLSPDSLDSATPVTVTIDAPPGATIRYTLDGSAPREASPRYERPLTLAQSATLRARAYAPGLRESIVTTATYIISPRPASPIAAPPPQTPP